MFEIIIYVVYSFEEMSDKLLRNKIVALKRPVENPKFLERVNWFVWLRKKILEWDLKVDCIPCKCM